LTTYIIGELFKAYNEFRINVTFVDFEDLLEGDLHEELSGISEFQDRIVEAFENNYFTNHKDFISYLEELVLAENSEITLGKYFNYLSIKLESLKNNYYDKIISFEIKGYDFDFDKMNFSEKTNEYYRWLFNQEYQLTFHESDYIDNNDILKIIFYEIDNSIEKANNIFSIKKLNSIEIVKVKPQNTSKKFESIVWNNNLNELAYLFWILREEKIIGCKKLGDTLSNYFLDGSINPIQNDLFNKYFGEFREGKFPLKAKEIDSIVLLLKRTN
jgi:hypothetical protein